MRKNEATRSAEGLMHSGRLCGVLAIYDLSSLGTAQMDELISFSFRIPKTLAASIEATAKRLGVSKSECARRAMEEFEERLMHERIAELSHRLAAQSASAARSMEHSTSDGLLSPF